jgi:GntR family transcriptional regulator of arabinose operon
MANDMISNESKPMYEKIFEELRDQIKQQHYQVGQRVPSEKELGEQYNVSRITSKKSLELLAIEGLIVRQPGRGSFVADPQEANLSQTKHGQSNGSYNKRKIGNKLLIGLVITDFGDSYGTELIYGMETASRAQDCYLVLRRSLGIPANEEEAIKGLLELGVDGLIIFPAQGEFFNAEILKLVIGQFPIVLIDRHLKGIAASSISTDNVQAAKTGTNYLFELGHKHIAFLSPPPIDTTAIEERIDGFIAAHAEKGIVVDRDLWLEDITSTLPTAYIEEKKQKDINKIQAHLQANPQITALFASEYNLALLAKEAVKQLGMEVPRDYSIICFDSPDLKSNGKYAFTHMKQDQEQMGRLAIENVINLKAGQQVSNKILLDAALIIGHSTGPCRK